MAETHLIEELERLVGPAGMRHFQAAPDDEKAGLIAFVERLSTLTDRELLTECQSAIMADSILQRFRGNHSSAYFKTDACCDEASRRSVAAGHDDWCPSSIYSRAHAACMRENGHTPGSTICTCVGPE